MEPLPRYLPASSGTGNARPQRRACSGDLGANLRSPPQIIEIVGAQICSTSNCGAQTAMCAGRGSVRAYRSAERASMHSHVGY